MAKRIGISGSASAPALPSMLCGLEDDSTEYLPRSLSLPTPSSASCRSRPMTSWDASSTVGSARPGSVSGSGRFSTEEMACFKRVKTPSSSCRGKSEVYWQTQGRLKKSLSEGANCWHTLPVLKGKFYSHDLLDNIDEGTEVRQQIKKPDVGIPALPDEAMTTVVLDEIFPRTPLAGGKRDSAWDISPEKMGLQLSWGASVTRKSNHRSPSRSQSAVDPKALARSPSSSSLGGAGGVASSSSANRLSAAASPAPSPVHHVVERGTRSLAPMVYFRQLLKERYGTIRDGMQVWNSEYPINHMMTRKEFHRIIQTRMGIKLPDDARESMFAILDIDGDGLVSLAEFHAVVDAAARVGSLRELRRRWIVSGFRSMNSALSLMGGKDSVSSKALTLREFGEALNCAHITEPCEHANLFHLIADESRNQVSVAELAAAISTVSPNLLLEELRERLFNKYVSWQHRANTVQPLHRAWGDLELACSKISLKDFESPSMRRFGLTELEAAKIFRAIDKDGMGYIDRAAFVIALQLVEPSLYLEELRRRVQQRFRSIRDVFSEAIEQDNGKELKLDAKLPLESYQELLLRVDLTEAESESLFNLIDAESSGALTISEFFWGAYHFVPLCAFEDLRLECLQRQWDVCTLFTNGVPEQQRLRMDYQAFVQLLAKLKLSSCLELPAMFDTLDVQSKGFTRISMLVAVLQAGGPGSVVKLEDDSLRSRAKQDIRCSTAPMYRLVGDLKAEARGGKDYSALPPEPEEHSCGGSRKVVRRSAHENASHASATLPRPGIAAVPRSSGLNSAFAPRLQSVPHTDLKGYVLQQARIAGPHSRAGEYKKTTENKLNSPQHSWNAVWRRINNSGLDKDAAGAVVDQIQGYYEEAFSSLSGDVPLLEQPPSRHALHHGIRSHQAVLEPSSKRKILTKGSESLGAQSLPPVV